MGVSEGTGVGGKVVGVEVGARVAPMATMVPGSMTAPVDDKIRFETAVVPKVASTRAASLETLVSLLMISNATFQP